MVQKIVLLVIDKRVSEMTEKKKSRKEFLSDIIKGSIWATLLTGFPFSKIFGITKNPKIYFKENPDSVKRNK
jgi:hypothetical protein